VHDGYLHILQASAKLLQDHHHEEIKSKTITTKRKRSGLVRGDGDKILFAPTQHRCTDPKKHNVNNSQPNIHRSKKQ
jgi:hypothetical protein